MLSAADGPPYRGRAPTGGAEEPALQGVPPRRRSARAAVALVSRGPLHRDTSYWVGATQAARILAVNVARLNQLVAKGFLPFEVHADGRRIYRREQLLTVANAREARWHP